MSLISVSEALQLMQTYKVAQGQELVPLQNATGRILREPITADRDFPPFDRVTKDGIAINYNDYEQGVTQFNVLGIQAAGEPPKSLTAAAGCQEVMTGAVLPTGADTIIMYEEVNFAEGKATVNSSDVTRGQNIHAKGADAQTGDVLLDAPVKLHAGHMNTLASIGKTVVSVTKLPKVALLSTGDELVDLDQTPAPHQIRKSNVYALKSLLQADGIAADLHHIHDEKNAVVALLAQLLEQYDVLVVTGGVSKGKYDFVPEALAHLGVAKVFHGIRQRPGKPFWFGTKQDKRVFALPGNPVSTFVCYLLYFRAWLGHSLAWPQQQMHLATDTGPALEHFWHHKLVKVSWSNQLQRFTPEPISNSGSGDIVSLNLANGILSVPPASINEPAVFTPFAHTPFTIFN